MRQTNPLPEKVAGFLLGDALTEFLSFKAAADALADDLKAKYAKALPFAGVVALSRAAVVARDMVKEDMRRVFKHPTPYAVNASRAVPATKQTMASAVVLREPRSGVAAENFLGPEIVGGQRHVKASEKALREAGVLPSGMFMEPSKKTKRDQYGNMLASEIVQMLAALKAFSSGSRTAKVVTRRSLAKRAKPRSKYFVAKSKVSGDPLGVYKVVSKGHVEPVVIFTRSPHYRERFDFYAVAKAHAQAVFPGLLDAALVEFGPK